MRLNRYVVALLAGVLCAASGCTSSAGEASDDPQPAGHTHAGDGSSATLLVGDGTRVSEVGYSLAGLQVREQPDGIGELRFRIDDHEGEPVTDYVEELTKELHLYVVNDDLTVFRHLHPTRDEDGSWTAPFDVPDAGGYRVVTEFIAVDEGGNGDHVVLGRPLALPPGDPGDTAAEDRAVSVSVPRPRRRDPTASCASSCATPPAGRSSSAPTSGPTPTSPASTARPGRWCTCTRSVRPRSPRPAPS